MLIKLVRNCVVLKGWVMWIVRCVGMCKVKVVLVCKFVVILYCMFVDVKLFNLLVNVI